MNRYFSYKKSLQKYINKRSCLKSYFNSTEEPTEMYEYIMSLINDDTFVIPIIFLTIVNSQNKKYNISMQSYYSASAIMFYCVISKFINQEKQMIKKFGNKIFYETINNLVSCATYSINQNMKIIKTNNHKNILDMYINLMHIHCRLVNTNYLLKTIDLSDIQDLSLGLGINTKNNDLVKWYTRDISEQIHNFKEIKDEDYNDYINKTIGSLLELSFTMGWIQGGGKLNEINSIKNISRYFAMMYKISIDFENLENDLEVTNAISHNYIINYGIQNSYNTYIENKYQFIEKCMNEEIYTNTMQEMVFLVDKIITQQINNISPDIMSSMSNS